MPGRHRRATCQPTGRRAACRLPAPTIDIRTLGLSRISRTFLACAVGVTALLNESLGRTIVREVRQHHEHEAIHSGKG
jgi:hypothetical protein